MRELIGVAGGNTSCGEIVSKFILESMWGRLGEENSDPSPAFTCSQSERSSSFILSDGKFSMPLCILR